MTRTATAAAALAFALGGAGSASAQAPGGMSASHFGGFDSIKTERFNFNLNTGDFSIPGHFTATREGSDVTADRASGNSKRKIMHAQGNVVVHDDGTGGAHGAKTSELAQKPSTLTCDTLDVDGTTKIYTATGNMHFVQAGREARSDRAVLDDANHHLHMEGNVHVKNGDQTIDAAVLDYDTQSGQLDGNGNVTIVAPVETAAPRTTTTVKKKKKIF